VWGFETTIPVLEKAKKFLVVDGKATVIGFIINGFPQIPLFSLLKRAVTAFSFEKRITAAPFTHVVKVQAH
jgi:hypothetical protein